MESAGFLHPHNLKMIIIVIEKSGPNLYFFALVGSVDAW